MTLDQAWNAAARMLARAKTAEVELYVDATGALKKNVSGRVTGGGTGRTRTGESPVQMLGHFPRGMGLVELREALRRANVFEERA